MGGVGLKTAIERIKVMERIRKEITRIPDLAADIEKNGLLHPVTVMSIENGAYRLIAGLRRVKAAQSLGWTEIEVNIVSPADAEAALGIEISENEQREPFTYSEKMDYARVIEEIERAKALERKSAGGKGGLNEDTDRGPYLHTGESRDIIGKKIGMSGRQFNRAKYIADHAPQEVIDQLDNGERTIRGTYDELRAKEKSGEALLPATVQKTDSVDIAAQEKVEDKLTDSRPRASADELTDEEIMERLNYSEKEKHAARKLREYNAMTPAEKIVELERQLREERARAATAESELAMLRENHGIAVDHKDSIIEFLKQHNAELIEALEAANKKIDKLETSN
jgi:ParB family chromosome partitioning protein